MSLSTNITDLATRIGTEAKALRTLLNGNAADLTALTTTAKTNLVAAINELDAAIGAGSPTVLDDLTDVVVTGATLGDILRHNGTNWVDVDGTTFYQPASAALDDVATNVSVSAATDLDAIRTRVAELDASVILMGAWDASVGTFPGGGTAQAGESWIVSVGGTVDGQVFSINDRIVAIADNASAVTYAANWLKLDYTDQVLSVVGQTGVVTIAQILTALLTVDGTGTGLDADLLDGLEAAAFALATDVGDTAANYVTTFEAALV